jgi:hypothetical protein
MRLFVIAVLVAWTGGTALAATPNLVGSWTRTAESAGLVGESAGYPASSKPTLINSSDHDWKMQIVAQDGNSFSGTLTGPVGKPQSIVGAFRQDGKRFVFATESDSGAGEATADEMEYCWTASSPRFVGAGCSTFKRNK